MRKTLIQGFCLLLTVAVSACQAKVTPFTSQPKQVDFQAAARSLDTEEAYNEREKAIDEAWGMTLTERYEQIRQQLEEKISVEDDLDFGNYIVWKPIDQLDIYQEKLLTDGVISPDDTTIGEQMEAEGVTKEALLRIKITAKLLENVLLIAQESIVEAHTIAEQQVSEEIFTDELTLSKSSPQFSLKSSYSLAGIMDCKACKARYGQCIGARGGCIPPNQEEEAKKAAAQAQKRNERIAKDGGPCGPVDYNSTTRSLPTRTGGCETKQIPSCAELNKGIEDGESTVSASQFLTTYGGASAAFGPAGLAAVGIGTAILAGGAIAKGHYQGVKEKHYPDGKGCKK